MNDNTISQENVQSGSVESKAVLKVHSADEILSTVFQAPVWAIPDILPTGLAILAGAPKVGKSWLALQIAKAVGGGGVILGKPVERGQVLYLALEDSARRLQSRMNTQSWVPGLSVDFIAIGEFSSQFGDLRNGGGQKLAQAIAQKEYRLVVIDTASRAITGDQNDVAVMTSGLTPLQEIAHKLGAVIILIDHHNKEKGFSQDMISNILGSTAKGAMADTVIGLYRERNKAGAKLAVTGREVEEKTINLRMDWEKGLWGLDTSNEEPTPAQDGVLQALKSVGSIGASELGEKLGCNRGTAYKQLTGLEEKGKVRQLENKKWKAVQA